MSSPLGQKSGRVARPPGDESTNMTCVGKPAIQRVRFDSPLTELKTKNLPAEDHPFLATTSFECNTGAALITKGTMEDEMKGQLVDSLVLSTIMCHVHDSVIML